MSKASIDHAVILRNSDGQALTPEEASPMYEAVRKVANHHHFTLTAKGIVGDVAPDAADLAREEAALGFEGVELIGGYEQGDPGWAIVRGPKVAMVISDEIPLSRAEAEALTVALAGTLSESEEEE